MKRSEMMAWTGLVGLAAIGLVLQAGGVMYNTTTFWAGMLLAFSQAIVCGVAGWGLSLAQQRAELQDLPAVSRTEGFRMSYGGESGTAPATAAEGSEVKTLDTGFQRMVVGLIAVGLLVSAGIVGYLIYSTFSWAKLNPDQPFPIAGTFKKPVSLDALALLIGLGAAGAYVVLYRITRPRRGAGVGGDAVGGNFTLGIGGMIAVGLATIAGWMNVAYGAEVAGAIICALLLLQGLELLVNAFRTYAGIEELDEEAIDLQAMPLAPMLSSIWRSGLNLLFAQSVGLSRTSGDEGGGVMSRMMPRAIVALVVIGILVSCLRVVQPGRVAILERLGQAQKQSDGKTYEMLKPGLHLTMPWPVDTLVSIPTEELQLTDVGTELHGEKSLGKVLDFQFWTFRPDMKVEENDTTDQFVTGDSPSQQILETYVVVMWRVRNAQKFYDSLSHSDFFEKEGEGTTAVPIYTALVQQCTNFAVTRTFAIHTLEEIMSKQRKEVEGHCKEILQKKLDEAGPEGKGCGIEVVDLTIKDLHPPLGIGEQRDPTQPDGVRRGPASAYENVVNAMQEKETSIKQGEAIRAALVNQATGQAASDVNEARADRFSRVAKAKGEATRLTATLSGIDNLPPGQRSFMESLAKRQAMYTAMKDVLGPINKIVIDPKVPNVDLYQTGNGMNMPAPPRPPG
jgi:membrane protease subunit HflK